MVVSDQYISRIVFGPQECNSVLIIDSNVVVPFPGSSQSLQSVAGWNFQIADIMGGIQHIKFSCRELPMTCASLSVGPREHTKALRHATTWARGTNTTFQALRPSEQFYI